MHAEEREEMSKVRSKPHQNKAKTLPADVPVFLNARGDVRRGKLIFFLVFFQGKHRDNTPYGEYGGWYKACKVNR